MRAKCKAADCGKPIDRHKEVRWVEGDFINGKYAIAYSKLYRFKCRWCATEHLARKTVPLDRVHPETFIEDYPGWDVWATALKNRPGMPVGGSAFSEGTELMARNPAIAFKKLLRMMHIASLPILPRTDNGLQGCGL